MTLRAISLAATAAAALVCLSADAGLAAEAQKAGMPQFDLSRFPSQIFWLAVTFLVLYWIMSKVALPRIGDVLEARANRIGSDLDRAASLKGEADRIRAAYEKTLAESRAKAQEVGRATESALARDAAARQAAVGTDLTARIRDAESRIAAATRPTPRRWPCRAWPVSRSRRPRLRTRPAPCSAAAESGRAPPPLPRRKPQAMADPASGSLLAKPEFWVAVSFVAFFVVVWKPLRATILGGLDSRAERIRKELDDAQRLREEAQTLLADFQRKQRDALQEADAIIARAKAEAERLQREAAARLEAELGRREVQALQRIALAEQAAAQEVRAAAVDVALAATRRLLEERLDSGAQARLIDEAIRELPGKLN